MELDSLMYTLEICSTKKWTPICPYNNTISRRRGPTALVDMKLQRDTHHCYAFLSTLFCICYKCSIIGVKICSCPN